MPFKISLFGGLNLMRNMYVCSMSQQTWSRLEITLGTWSFLSPGHSTCSCPFLVSKTSPLDSTCSASAATIVFCLNHPDCLLRCVLALLEPICCAAPDQASPFFKSSERLLNISLTWNAKASKASKVLNTTPSSLCLAYFSAVLSVL